jgi:hypothetical protein
VRPIADGAHSVPIDRPTVWDFVKRSISDDLTQPPTRQSKTINASKWRYDIFRKEQVRWGVSPWSLFDIFEEVRGWFSIRSLPGFSSQREIKYELAGPSYRLVISGRYQEDIPQSLITFVRRTRGQLAITPFPWMEQEQRKDLKPFRPDRGLLVSDWYDGANAGRTLDRLKSFPPTPEDTDEKKAQTDPWLDSSSPLWGMNSSANRANREINTDVS